MRSRKHHDERQLALSFLAGAAVERRLANPASAANEPEFKRFFLGAKKAWTIRGTLSLPQLADQVRAEDRLRLLEPTSLPKRLRGRSSRPRPQTAIIAYAAQRAYQRRVAPAQADSASESAIQEFLSMRASRLRRLANQLRQRGPTR